MRELTGGLGVDAAIECSGSAAALDACIQATRSLGTVAQTGLHVRPAPIDAFQLSLHEITLVGTWCYPVTDWPRIIALLASGGWTAAPRSPAPSASTARSTASSG